MEWTFADFFADGGTTTFIDRLAASLGIHGSDIKIVSVYEGSLIIDYKVYTPFDDPVSLEVLRVQQISMFANNQMNLGAPILDSSVNTVNIITDGVVTADGYSPIIITPTLTNTI